MEIIPLRNVEIDIQNMVDKVFIGPQGDLLRKVKDFNDCFAQGKECIRITNKWRFKPGVYPAVKDAYNIYVNKFGMKPRGLYSLRDRIHDYSYQGRQFWAKATEIEQDMWRFRQNNNTWVDNAPLIEESWQNAKDHFIPKIDEFNENHPEFNLRVGLNSEAIEESGEWGHLRMYTMMDINEITIQVHRLSNICAEIPWGDITLRWSTNFWDMLNALCNADGNTEVLHDNSNLFCRNPHAKITPMYEGMDHPFVSSHRSYYDSDIDSFISNVCVGDLDSSLRSSVRRFDYEATAMIAKRWLSNYHIPNTNPLNRISKCFYGLPEIANSQLLMAGRPEGHIFNPDAEMSRCYWSNIVANKRSAEINVNGTLESPAVFEFSPCDNCQFKDGYAYAQENGDVKHYKPCASYARMEYRDPVTEDDCIIEAALMIFMCRNIIQEDSYNPYVGGRASEIPITYPPDCKDLIHENAYIENILERNPDIYLPHFWTRTMQSISIDVEDILDRLFLGSLWQDTYNEWEEINFGDGGGEQHAIEDFACDHEHLSIPELRELIEQHRNTVANVPDVLSDEERVIAWAARNGSAINIGESR